MSSRELLGGLSFVVLVDVLYAVGLWRNWPRKTYERMKDLKAAWLWLDIFGIPKTERNCIRFIWGISIAGMILVTACGVLQIVTFLYSHSK
jgi:hypothetical protein